MKERKPNSIWSWLVLACGFISNVIVFGCSYCFGILYPELLQEFNESRAKTGEQRNWSMQLVGSQQPLGAVYNFIFAKASDITNMFVYVHVFVCCRRPAKSHGFAVSLTIFDTFSRSHDKGPKSHDFCRQMPVKSGSYKITQ